MESAATVGSLDSKSSDLRSIYDTIGDKLYNLIIWIIPIICNNKQLGCDNELFRPIIHDWTNLYTENPNHFHAMMAVKVCEEQPALMLAIKEWLCPHEKFLNLLEFALQERHNDAPNGATHIYINILDFIKHRHNLEAPFKESFSVLHRAALEPILDKVVMSLEDLHKLIKYLLCLSWLLNQLKD